MDKSGLPIFDKNKDFIFSKVLLKEAAILSLEVLGTYFCCLRNTTVGTVQYFGSSTGRPVSNRLFHFSFVFLDFRNRLKNPKLTRIQSSFKLQKHHPKMALVCSIDFNTSPMNSNVHDLEFLDRSSIAKSTYLDQADSFHFEKGRITPDLPMFTASSSCCLDDFEPVPIGAVKTPHHQAALESMLKETVEFLFGSSSASSSKRKLLEEDGSMNKKRRRSSDFSDDGSSRSSGSDDLRFRPYQS